jgi:two-component system, OmpR family, response regulator TctD
MALLIVTYGRSNDRSEQLRADGYAVVTAASVADALTRLLPGDIDAMLLDADLPVDEALALIEEVHARELAVPILVISSALPRAHGLYRGADRVLAESVEHDELAAHIRAVMRRASAPRWGSLTCNGLMLQQEVHGVMLRDTWVALSPREHALLWLLLRRGAEPTPRESLCAMLRERIPGANNYFNHLLVSVREKIGTELVAIEYLHGLGYRLRATQPGERMTASVA